MSGNDTANGPYRRSHEGLKRGEWAGLWSLFAPEEAALCALDLHGALASPVLISCMLGAMADQRADDYRFFTKVLQAVEREEAARRADIIAELDAMGLTAI